MLRHLSQLYQIQLGQETVLSAPRCSGSEGYGVGADRED
jgi:hypothetical protein